MALQSAADHSFGERQIGLISGRNEQRTPTSGRRAKGDAYQLILEGYGLRFQRFRAFGGDLTAKESLGDPECPIRPGLPPSWQHPGDPLW